MNQNNINACIPPADNMIYRYEPDLARHITQQHQQTKICKVCDFPVTIKIFIEPCKHYMCFQCFSNQPNYCLICDVEVQKCEEVPQNKEFITCNVDNCYRYFENENKYKEHLSSHQ